MAVSKTKHKVEISKPSKRHRQRSAHKVPFELGKLQEPQPVEALCKFFKNNLGKIVTETSKKRTAYNDSITGNTEFLDYKGLLIFWV